MKVYVVFGIAIAFVWNFVDGVNVIPRNKWGAKISKTPSSKAAWHAYVYKATDKECSNLKTCRDIIQNIQNYHMDSKGWGDIGYNFLIDGSGNIYEGCGWDRPAEVIGEPLKWSSIAIGVLGNYKSSDKRKDTITQKIENFLQSGIKKGLIQSSYTLVNKYD